MILALIISLVIVATAFLVFPFALKAMLNNALHKMDGYTGRVDRLQINVFKSKIYLQGIRIRTDSDTEHDKPFLLAPAITIAVKWGKLLRKVVDLTIVLDKPKVLVIAGEPLPSEDDVAKQPRELPSLKNSIEKLVAFRINVEIREGTIRYANSHSNLDITATDLTLAVLDFSNRTSMSQACRIAGRCHLYEGSGEIKATLIPLAPTLTLDLNLELKSINLVLLNDLLRKHGKVDLDNGTLDLYAEVAVADNTFKGYIRPVLKDLDFISAEDRGDGFFRKVWERLVAGFYNVLENNRKHQVVAKIPIEGRLDDPHIRVGVAIVSMLRNAFVKTLTPSFEDIINFKSLWNNPKRNPQEEDR